MRLSENLNTPQTCYNPINGEYTTIIESALQSGGSHSLLEVSLNPGGGNPMHYHTRFTEEFTAVKGILSIGLGYKVTQLHPGESILVPIRTEHRFFNATDDVIIFRIKLRDGQPGFENFIKALFGLVRDGRTSRQQIPYNIYYAAVLLHWGDTHLKNPFFRFLAPFAHYIYRRAARLGIEERLLDKYCR